MRLRGSLVVVLAGLMVLPSCSWFRDDEDDDDDAEVFSMAIVEPRSLDPIKASSVDEQLLADQLYDGLVHLDPATAAPLPGVATAWTTSPDGLVWEFTLGEAIFGDGEDITAADVKATLDRAVDKESGSAVADLLEPVVGWRASAVDGTATQLEGVSVVSDDVVRVTLAAPWSSLPVALAHPGLGIVPEDAPASDDEPPVGSGPYALDDEDDDTLTLRATEGREVRMSRIDVVQFSDQAAAYEAFLDGDVDWSPVPISSVEEASARFGPEHFRSFVAELFYAFNLRLPKWADRRVREAAVRAVNRQAIIDEVYAGTMRPMTSFAVTGVPGAVSDTCGELCVVDVERAKALVAEVASGGPVPEIGIDFDGEPAQTQVAEHIERDLEAVGFVVTLRPRPVDEYEGFAASGEQDLFRLGWVAAYPAMDGFVAPLFASASANNLAGFGSPAVDALIGQGRATADAAASNSAYEQAERAVFSEAAVIPIGQFQQHWVAADRVRDLQLTVTGTFDAASVWLAED
jgi:oligopeptide transport system substrate-binding protein